MWVGRGQNHLYLSITYKYEKQLTNYLNSFQHWNNSIVCTPIDPPHIGRCLLAPQIQRLKLLTLPISYLGDRNWHFGSGSSFATIPLKCFNFRGSLNWGPWVVPLAVTCKQSIFVMAWTHLTLLMGQTFCDNSIEIMFWAPALYYARSADVSAT